jgi:hypothetical protein
VIENISVEAPIVKAEGGVALSDAQIDDQLEAIAQEIEGLERDAAREIERLEFQIAERLAKAHRLFRYRRDEGGFRGWVKKRLGCSRSKAYRALDVDRLAKVSPHWDTFGTLPYSVVCQLAAPSTPDEVHAAVAGRIKAGEMITCATVIEVIAHAKEAANPTTTETKDTDVEAGEEDPSIIQRRDEHAKLFTESPEVSATAPQSTKANGETGGFDHHNGQNGHAHHGDAGNHNGGEETAAGSGFGDLLRQAWDAAPEAQAEIIQAEPVDRLLALMSDQQRGELFDRLVSQEIAQASFVGTRNSGKLLTSLTGTLHFALSRIDSADGAQALKVIAAKLRANKLEPSDLCLTLVKRKR